MAEVPQEALQAAAEAVNAHEWRPGRPFAAHARHQFDGGCGVCTGDVAAITAVGVEAAAPLLAAQVRRQTAQQIAEAIEARRCSLDSQYCGTCSCRLEDAELAREIGEAP